MEMRKLLLPVALLGVCAWGQSSTYKLGRTPTADEIKAIDIAINPVTGKELPVGRGTAAEGAKLFAKRAVTPDIDAFTDPPTLPAQHRAA